MARRMVVKSVDGLRDLLAQVVLMTPNSRMLEPSADVQEQVIRLGDAFIHKAAQDPAHDGATIYAAYQWPETGPALLAFVWAINTRHPDPEERYFCAFTETKEPSERLLTRDQMEHELALFAVKQFGRPTPV